VIPAARQRRPTVILVGQSCCFSFSGDGAPSPYLEKIFPARHAWRKKKLEIFREWRKNTGKE
jgi:hypothetical protein